MNWRTIARFDAQLDTGLDQERVMYYDQSWRLLEERIDDDFDAEPGDGADRALQYVWGMRYIDDIAFRRSNDNLSNDDPDVTYNSEWYYATDALFSAVAIFRGRGALTERVQYDAYGAARHQRPGDVDGDGDTDGADNAAYLTIFNATIDQATYNVDADINRDGVINGTDGTLLTNDFGAALPKGQLSNTDNIIGFDGYVFNAPDEVYTVRNRSYDFHQGRWLESDSADFIDGANLFEYVQSKPISLIDPIAMASVTGPEAAIISWLPSGFTVGGVAAAFIASGGNWNIYGFSVAAQVTGANAVANPSPPISIGVQPGAPGGGPPPWYEISQQHRGYLAVKGSLDCCNQGELAGGTLSKWSHQGWTPQPLGFLAAEMHPGHPAITSLPPTQPNCVRWRATMASRVDLAGQLFTYVTSGAFPPYISREIEYELCCNGKYKIDYRGSQMPAHRSYLNGVALATHNPTNTDFAHFILFGINNNGGVMPPQHITTASNWASN